MPPRARLLIAAGVIALVVIGVVRVTQGGTHHTPRAAPPVFAAAAEPAVPLRLVLPPDERAAERVLMRRRVPELPSLADFLTIASLPYVPRLGQLHAPPPPLRTHRMHVAATRLSLTAREAPLVPSDRPLAQDWPVPTIAGALPPGFRFTYADDYRGWPVEPLHGWHVLHGGFDDPREGGYHFGVDIAVDDAHPAKDAPRGLSHRVYAVESGVMHWAKNTTKHPCNARRFDIGHFSYWHVTSAVPYGAHVKAGQWVGWTCLNEWHVHLSEWARVDGKKRWVNPLHPGGRLVPYVDKAAPVIRAVYAYGPPAKTWKPDNALDLTSPDGAAELGLGDLHGAVDLRAWINDSQGFLGVFRTEPNLASTTAPYKVWVQIRQLSTNAIVWQRTTFQNDLLMSGVLPFFALYASGSRSTLSDYDCLHSHIPCDGRLFYHLIVVGGRYLWDTRSVENGAYQLTIKAYDIKGNVTTRVVAMRVKN